MIGVTGSCDDGHSQKTEYALVSSLQRDALLAKRIKRRRTVPGVRPITTVFSFDQQKHGADRKQALRSADSKREDSTVFQ
jgi:hypothetical protein